MKLSTKLTNLEKSYSENVEKGILWYLNCVVSLDPQKKGICLGASVCWVVVLAPFWPSWYICSGKVNSVKSTVYRMERNESWK